MPEGTYHNLKAIRRQVLMNDGIGFIEVGEECKVWLPAEVPVVISVEDEIQIAERMLWRFRTGGAGGGRFFQ